MKKKTIWPFPGEILKETLDECGISAARLSKATHLPPSRITEILKGRRAVTVDTALRLGKALGTTPDYWLNLQKSYDIRTAETSILNDVEVLVSSDA